jgi:putative ubiquitin-RnfH superfamily antitoxin RatB of RatAB toxin-antitoxin module
MANEHMICVYVVYALPDRQELVSLELPANSTVKHAITESFLLQKYSEIQPENMQVGIYGKIVQNTQLLQDQDRVEIYRSLSMDPMQARRLRAGI